MGATSATAEDEAVREFQEDASVRLLVLDTRAGGVGLTLTAATAAAMVGFPWTWADVEQATDRAYGRVNEDGRDHRASLIGEREERWLGTPGPRRRRNAGAMVYVWLKRNGFPAGFRVWCFNRSIAERSNGGLCPHQDGERWVGRFRWRSSCGGCP